MHIFVVNCWHLLVTLFCWCCVYSVVKWLMVVYVRLCKVAVSRGNLHMLVIRKLLLRPCLSSSVQLFLSNRCTAWFETYS